MREFAYIEDSTITISKPKSVMKCGNININNEHRFNWIQRKMWKLLLGFDVRNMEAKR